MAEKKLEQEELEILQKLNKDFQIIKQQLGDLEIQKHGALKSLDIVQNMFKEQEQKLVEKYGANSVINLETGIISEKEESESPKE